MGQTGPEEGAGSLERIGRAIPGLVPPLCLSLPGPGPTPKSPPSSYSLASWTRFWCWSSCAATGCWRASASAARASLTGLSSRSSASGEPTGPWGHGAMGEWGWTGEQRWHRDVIPAPCFQLRDPSSKCHPQGLYGWKAGLHSHGEPSLPQSAVGGVGGHPSLKILLHLPHG